jgi:hypothetical protein
MKAPELTLPVVQLYTTIPFGFCVAVNQAAAIRTFTVTSTGMTSAVASESPGESRDSFQASATVRHQIRPEGGQPPGGR